MKRRRIDSNNGSTNPEMGDSLSPTNFSDTSPEKNSRQSPALSGTSSEGTSSTEISSDNIDFMLNISVVGLGKSLHVKISPNRLRTELGNVQGDHVTAFRTFFELISSGISNQEPENAIDSLCYIASCYLPQSANDHLEKLKEECESKLQEKSMPREERKQLTGTMRSQTKIFKSNDIEQVKYALKYVRTSILATYTEEIAAYIVQETNQLENMTFARDRIGNVDDKSEGSRIKMAIKSLASIDKLASLTSENQEELQDLLKEMHSGEYYYFNGINNFFKKYNEKINNKKICIEKNAASLIHVMNILDSINKKEQGKIAVDAFIDTFAGFMEDLYDYRGATSNDDVSVLCRSSARHIVILFHSFKNILNKFSEKHKTLICEKFLDKIYNNQDWSGHYYIEDLEEKEFTLLSYRAGVKELLSKDMFSLSENKVFANLQGESNVFRKDY